MIKKKKNQTKIPRCMKLAGLFLMGALTFASATETYGQKKNITIEVKNQSVQQVLDEIEAKSEFNFFYNNKQINTQRLVSVNVSNKNVFAVLKQLFKNTNIGYQVLDKSIILSVKEAKIVTAQQAEKKVTGTVLDENGETIIGANVVVKGTTNGTITDIDGAFTINASPNATLVISFIGYSTQEIKIANNKFLQIKLSEDSKILDEIVVIGYGTQKKVNLTGAVDVIKNDVLTNRQAPTVSQLLQGVSPGLNLAINDQNGFQPGAKMDISIRGIGSLNGGQPYIVIDGIPGDINNLNPEDIESISVLKDAAASAIYGARAPYGVILITTKRGKKGDKFSVTYSGNVSVNTPQPLPTPLDSYTWTRVLNEAGQNRGGNPFNNATIDRIIAFQNKDWNYLKQSMPNYPEGANIMSGAFPNGNMWDHANNSFANNNFYDIFYGHSVNQKHNLSFQGGSKNASYYFSAGYLDQNGVLNYGTDSFQRINLMGKVNLSITDWLDFSWETRVAKKDRARPSMSNYGDYSALFGMISSIVYPISPVYDGFGHYSMSSAIPMIEDGGTDTNNEIDNWNTFKMEIRPLKGWKINANFAYNTYSSVNSNLNSHIPFYDLDQSPYFDGESVPNSINRIHNDNRYWTSNIFSSYEYKINNAHQFSLLVGLQLEKSKYAYLQAYKTNLIVEEVPSIQTATGSPTVAESLSHSATEGYFSRLSYNYKERYLLESNIRYDGSYVFRAGNRWGFFPSFSLGWNVNKEPFWNIPGKAITTLKFRGSWGQLGNQNVNPYSDLELIPIISDKLNWIFNYGDNRPVGYTGSPGIVNRNLTWETATTKNLGMDISLLNNKLQANFDLYERLTSDMVGRSEAKPGVLGTNVPQDNNSSLRTRGWELALKWKDMFDNGLSYFVGLNLYDSKSVVTKYYNPTGTLSNWYEGQELGEIWGYTVNDLFRSQEEVDKYLVSTDLSQIASVWRPGDVKYEDTNHDGKVNNGTYTKDNHGDLSIIGNTEPHWQYGINAGLNYKGFDISMLWHGVAKKDIYFSSGSNLYWGFMDGWWESGLTSRNLDYFRDQPGTKYIGLYEGDANINTGAYWPRPYLNRTENNKNKIYPNTRYLQDASYLRLQNVQLGYTLPQHMVSRLSLQKLRIYFSGENLITLTKLPKGIDAVAPVGFPRGGSFSGTNGTGRLTYGAERSYSLGITIIY